MRPTPAGPFRAHDPGWKGLWDHDAGCRALTSEKVCQNARHFSSRASPLTPAIESTSAQFLAHRLDGLRLIRVAGIDRVAFLQGQFTQDVRTVNPSRSALFGWATAQGRLLAVGQMFEWRDAFWLTASAGTVDALLPRLRMFVLRAKVSVEPGDAIVTGLSGPGAAASLATWRPPSAARAARR